jgi:ferritin
MISEKIQGELNQRIQDELFAWYLYFAISAYFETQNLKGFAKWMKAQGHEEMAHATRNYDFLIARGSVATLQPLAAPPAKWDSVLAALEAAYAHEQKVSKIYNQFMDLALAEKDHATAAHIQWFVTEQVEEEEQTLDLVLKVKMAHGSTGALLALDHQVGKRE